MIALVLTAVLAQADLGTVGSSQLDAPVIHVPAHETVPWDATCMTKTQAQKVAVRCLACEETLKIVEDENFVLNKKLFLVVGAATVVALVAAGIAVGVAMPRGTQ